MPRMTVNLPDPVNSLLEELADRQGTTKTEILRRALALYDYVEDETADDKLRLALIDKQDHPKKEIVLLENRMARKVSSERRPEPQT